MVPVDVPNLQITDERDRVKIHVPARYFMSIEKKCLWDFIPPLR